MEEPFQIRIVLLLVLFGVASVYDYKTRKIPDILWVVFSGIGGMLYLVDYPESFSAYHVISFFTSSFFGFVLYRMRLVGMADMFGIISISIILPVHYEFVMIPIVILVMAFFVVVFSTIIYNVSLNLSEMIRIKKWIFSEFKLESKYKKVLAFFAVHRKRRYEKFVIPTESSMSITPAIKSFVFFSSRNNVTRNSQLESNGMYVQNIPPLISYMFGVSIFLLLPEIL